MLLWSSGAGFPRGRGAHVEVGGHVAPSVHPCISPRARRRPGPPPSAPSCSEVRLKKRSYPRKLPRVDLLKVRCARFLSPTVEMSDIFGRPAITHLCSAITRILVRRCRRHGALPDPTQPRITHTASAVRCVASPAHGVKASAREPSIDQSRKCHVLYRKVSEYSATANAKAAARRATRGMPRRCAIVT
jgi:hypothetical protein